MRRIAISADSANGLDSTVSAHFGRCPYYVLVDVEGHEVRAISTVANPYYEQHAPGQVPFFIRDQRAQAMITGGMGGRAIAMFEQFGIEPVTGASGSVRDALEAYLGGRLRGADTCRSLGEHGEHRCGSGKTG